MSSQAVRSFTRWLRSLRPGAASASQRRHSRQQPCSRRLQVEQLEDRVVPSGTSFFYASQVVSYVPGTIPDASYNNPSAALGGLNPSIGTFTGISYYLTPFDPAFQASDLVEIGAGGSLVIRLAATASANGSTIGVHTGLGLLDANYPAGTNANPASYSNSFLRQADVQVSADGVHWGDLGTITFDSPSNYYAGAATDPEGLSPGVGPLADPGKPFLGSLSSFNGLSWQRTLGVLDGSTGGTWLNLSGVTDETGTPIAGVNYVKFSVPTNPPLDPNTGKPEIMMVDAVVGINTLPNQPTVQMPGPQSVLDNAALPFTAGNSNAITVADASNATTVETLYLQDFYGRLHVSNTAGLNSIAGNNTALVTMTGTLSALNAALDGLRYVPPAFTYNFAEPLSATLVAPDNHSATGGTLLQVAFASRALVPAAQTVLDTSTLTLASARGTAVSVADPAVTSAEVESVYLQTLWGTLHISTVGANTTVVGNDTSLITLRGPLTELNAALDGLRYTPARFTYSYPDTLDVLLQTQDGPVASAVAINVLHGNIAPTVSLPNAQSVNAGTTLGFSTANGNPISVADADANGHSETVTLQATAGAGALAIRSTAGLSFVAGNGTTLLGFTGTLAQLNAALNGLSFTPRGTFQVTAFLSVLVNDNAAVGAQSAGGSIAINVAPVGNPPSDASISGPNTQVVAGSGAVAFSPSIRVSDPDSNGAIETLMLQAVSGSLTVTNTAGLASSSGSGTANLTLNGTVAALNSALQSLTYLAGTGAATDFINVTLVAPNGTGVETATLSISLTITANPVGGG